MRLVGVVLVLAAIAVVVYWFGFNHREHYRNSELGFEFSYPASWGEVEFSKVSLDQVSQADPNQATDVTGSKFTGSFTKNDQCGFGGLTDNYSSPTETPRFANGSWSAYEGKYYWASGNVEFLPVAVREQAGRMVLELLDPEYGETGRQERSFVVDLDHAEFPTLTIGCLDSKTFSKDLQQVIKSLQL